MKNVSAADTHESDHESPPNTPRWVKVFGVIGLALILLFVIVKLTGNSPFMHIPPIKPGVPKP